MIIRTNNSFLPIGFILSSTPGHTLSSASIFVTNLVSGIITTLFTVFTSSAIVGQIAFVIINLHTIFYY